jgi:hypothetical protein
MSVGQRYRRQRAPWHRQAPATPRWPSGATIESTLRFWRGVRARVRCSQPMCGKLTYFLRHVLTHPAYERSRTKLHPPGPVVSQELVRHMGNTSRNDPACYSCGWQRNSVALPNPKRRPDSTTSTVPTRMSEADVDSCCRQMVTTNISMGRSRNCPCALEALAPNLRCALRLTSGTLIDDKKEHREVPPWVPARCFRGTRTTP